MNVFKENFVSLTNQRSFPLSATCNCDCFYCSNKQNPFNISTNLFIDKQTLQELVYMSNIPIDSTISLSDVLPGKILSEGEALIHPKFFEMIDIIRKKYPTNKIEIRTNGIALTSDVIYKLSKYKPLQISISLHCLDAQKWAEIYNTSPSKQKVVLNALPLLKQNRIGIKFEMIPLPSFVGYNEIENTIKFMSKYVRHLYFWKPSWTKMTPKDVVDKMKYDKNEMISFIKNMREKYNVFIRNEFNNIFDIGVIHEIIKSHSIERPLGSDLVILTSKAAYDDIKNMVNIQNEWINSNCIIDYIPNETFGGNIDCAGLLTFSDISKAIDKYKDYKYFNLPATIFTDHFGNDLTEHNIFDFIKQHNDKVINFGPVRKLYY